MRGQSWEGVGNGDVGFRLSICVLIDISPSMRCCVAVAVSRFFEPFDIIRPLLLLPCLNSAAVGALTRHAGPRTSPGTEPPRSAFGLQESSSGLEFTKDVCTEAFGNDSPYTACSVAVLGAPPEAHSGSQFSWGACCKRSWVAPRFSCAIPCEDDMCRARPTQLVGCEKAITRFGF